VIAFVLRRAHQATRGCDGARHDRRWLPPWLGRKPELLYAAWFDLPLVGRTSASGSSAAARSRASTCRCGPGRWRRATPATGPHLLVPPIATAMGVRQERFNGVW